MSTIFQNPIQTLLHQATKRVVSVQRLINRILVMMQIILLLAWSTVFILVVLGSGPSLYLVREVGNTMGTISLLLFCITLLPGIITRLRWHRAYTQPIAVMITPLRRHLGILMFLTAFAHMSFVISLPHIAQVLSLSRSSDAPFSNDTLVIILDSLPPPLVLFEQFAVIAWLLLIPVWLTSNDFSQRKLGGNWKKIQRLTYAALWFIFAHVALQAHVMAAFVGIVGILELTSWIMYWQRQSSKSVL